MKTIADRLKVARRKAGLTQDLMACHLEVSQFWYWQLENGQCRALGIVDKLIKLAKATGVNPTWLIMGEGKCEV